MGLIHPQDALRLASKTKLQVQKATQLFSSDKDNLEMMNPHLHYKLRILFIKTSRGQYHPHLHLGQKFFFLETKLKEVSVL